METDPRLFLLIKGQETGELSSGESLSRRVSAAR